MATLTKIVYKYHEHFEQNERISMSTKSKYRNLKVVVAIRHGEESEKAGSFLTLTGQDQMKEVVTRLRKILSFTQKILVLTSPLPRAIESGEIIAQGLGVKRQTQFQLKLDGWAHGSSQKDSILYELEDVDVEAVIVVTHFAAPSGIAHAFASEFGKEVEGKECENGNGYIIFLETGQVVEDLLSYNPAQ